MGLSVLWTLCFSIAASAQTAQDEPGEASGSEPSSPAAAGAATTQEPSSATPPSRQNYLLPDLAPGALTHNGKRFFFKPLFAWVFDTTAFEQDDASIGQVSQQEDKGELRAGRLGFTLRSKSKFAWELYVTTDYQERANREKTALQLYDLRIGLPIGKGVKVYIGKQKMPFVYELIGLSVALPHSERILNCCFVTRSIGVLATGPLAGGRGLWGAGVFNDWLDSDLSREENGTDYVARLSGLAWTTPRDRDYLHLGVGYRRVGADDGELRFRGRPESNVADYYLDTGNFPADHADQLVFEMLFVKGPFELLAERVGAGVDAPERGDPDFSGYYATGSWILTGEGRPYLRPVGFAGLIVPRRRLGAFELVARYSHIDLTEREIDGGVLDKWSVGLNWWASTQWKVGLSWGDGDLDRFGTVGNTRSLLARIQWLY